MTKISIPQETAQQLVLFAQGLYRPLERPAEKNDLAAAVSKLGVVQIDTIHIVARSPYFFFWSRLGNYDPAWLNELLEEKQVFEYWAHAASILPAEDYALHRRLMLENQRLPGFVHWYEKNKAECDAVLNYVREHSEVRSADFERKDGIKGTWWNWKVEKQALEYWFAKGELMVSKRVNFQRVYDLRERMLPDWSDELAPDLETATKTLLHRSIRSLGFALPAWIGDYFRFSKTATQAALKSLLEEKTLLEISIDGWKDAGWVDPEIWETFQQETKQYSSASLTTLLTPFDSLIWDRARTRQLFNFDYSIECYLPAGKRRYGYFVLPILHNGKLIGRVDAKAHRGLKKFEVITLYLEPGTPATREVAESIAGALIRCAQWHKTPEVMLGKCEPETFRPLLATFF